jgi:hypothetical protein
MEISGRQSWTAGAGAIPTNFHGINLGTDNNAVVSAPQTLEKRQYNARYGSSTPNKERNCNVDKSLTLGQFTSYTCT